MRLDQDLGALHRGGGGDIAEEGQVGHLGA
jgi:hypothetical protein